MAWNFAGWVMARIDRHRVQIAAEHFDGRLRADAGLPPAPVATLVEGVCPDYPGAGAGR